jgi:hypothetical protein
LIPAISGSYFVEAKKSRNRVLPLMNPKKVDNGYINKKTKKVIQRDDGLNE